MSVLRKLLNSILPKKNSDLLIEDQIIVFGDSHSRAFSFNPNFMPFFIGAGKENNFINDENAKRVEGSLRKALSGLDGKKVMFCFGEPDTRHYLGLGWYPWEGKRLFELDDFRPSIDESVKRYSKMIKNLRKDFSNEMLVFNATPSTRSDQNEITDYFNAGMKKACESIQGVLFIDINSKIYVDTEELIDQQYYSDTVHLNNKIQILVEDFLLGKGVINQRGYDSELKFSHKKVQSKYEYNEQFGCYVLK